MVSVIGLFAAAISTSVPGFLPTMSAGGDRGWTSKLDRDLAEVYQSLQPGTRQIRVNGGCITQAGDSVRVVIDLRAPASQSFAIRGYSGIQDVRAAVRSAQDSVLRQLLPEEFVLALRLDIQYAMSGYLTSAGLAKLLASPEVDSIVPDYLNEMDTVEGRAMTRSDYAANTMGDTGAGNTVAMIDSAFDYLHAELGGATPSSDTNTSSTNTLVTYMKDFSGDTLVNDPALATPDDDVYPMDFDDGYHGTGTAAIVHRYAPGAKLALLKVFPNSYNSIIANAINWCVSNKNVEPSAPITLISMSLGGGSYSGSCSTGTIQTAVDNAKAAGIVCFVASGNDGYRYSIQSPACDPDVISVGSVWDLNNPPYQPFPPANCSDTNRVKGERACYSNASPELDLYAPSEEVITAQVFGGTFALGGTSSATPAAAGCAAQLLQARPSLRGDANTIKNLFYKTGRLINGNPDPMYNNKWIDVAAAIPYTGSLAPEVVYFTATPSDISSGSSTQLEWKTKDANYVKIAPFTGKYNPTGYFSVWPKSTTTYTLTAYNAAGTVSASVTVTVAGSSAAPVVNSFTANPGTISAGASSTLAWDCSNTSSVSISGVAGTFGASGSTSVSPTATTSYALTATGTGGTASASVTVTVTAGATEVEPNNSTSSANVLSNGANTSGYISASSDIDYFKITIGGSKTVSITLQVPAGLDYDLKLYSTGGSILGTSQNPAGQAESITYKNPSTYSRSYYIKVYSYSGTSTTANYLLRATW